MCDTYDMLRREDLPLPDLPPPRSRRKFKRHDSYAFDLAIFHATHDDDVTWANYLKTELQQKTENESRITLISDSNFDPALRDDIQKTVHNSYAALVIVTPSLIGFLQDNPSISFDFIDPEKMAAVLFYCGVNESDGNVKARFPNYDKWRKLIASQHNEEIQKIFDVLANLLEAENSDSQLPEQNRVTRAGLQSRRFKKRRPRTNRKATWIFPDRGRCDQETRACVIFDEGLPADCQLQVEMRGQISHTSKTLETMRLNPTTFQFTIPEGSPEEVKLGYMRDGTCVAVGVFQHESPLDDIDPLMKMMISCLDAACGNQDKGLLDRDLHRHLTSDDIPPRALEQLFSLYQLSNTDECTTHELPTLLHLVAKHGLKDAAGFLVGLPGAYHAYQSVNAQGYTPADIAEQKGHAMLHNFFVEFFDTVSKEEIIYDQVCQLLQNGALDICVDAPQRDAEADQDPDGSYFPMNSQASDESLYLPMDKLSADPPPLSSPDSPNHGQIDSDIDFANMPSLDLPSPIPMENYDPDYRKRLDTLQRTEHVKSTDFVDGNDSKPSDGVMASPFPTLLDPNQTPPPASAYRSQEELLDIMHEVRDGRINIPTAERMVTDWKQRHEHQRRTITTFSAQQDAIKRQHQSHSSSLEKVESGLPVPQKGILTSMLKVFRGRKGQKMVKSMTAPPDLRFLDRVIQDYHLAQKPPRLTKSKTAPPGTDTSRLALATAVAPPGDDDDNPVCDSLPELPTNFQSQPDPEINRFSTISNSSSSSAHSQISCQDSGIDTPRREESPGGRGRRELFNSHIISVYDIPTTPPVELPLPARSQRSTSDEGSGYEDMDHWVNSDQGSVRTADSSTSSQQSASPTFIEVDKDAPPLPPRTGRRSGSTSSIDFMLPRSPTKSPAPKPPNAGRVFTYAGGIRPPNNKRQPAVPPKPMTKVPSSENMRKEGMVSRPGGGIPVRSTSRASQLPRPGPVPPNYSNVVAQLDKRNKEHSQSSSPGHSDQENNNTKSEEVAVAPPKLPPRKISQS